MIPRYTAIFFGNLLSTTDCNLILMDCCDALEFMVRTQLRIFPLMSYTDILVALELI